MPPSMANWESDPYRVAIASLSIDGLDRLWITDGTTTTASFDVYDLDGNHLFTAALDVGSDLEIWHTMICQEKFICYDAAPEDFPKVFYGDLPGFE